LRTGRPALILGAMSETGAVTLLLEAARAGDERAMDQLFRVVYEELHRLARVVRVGRAGATLNTTALVHEAYVKLIPSRDLDWQGRAHFFRVVARAMRQVLCNAAEARMAQKRGGGLAAVTLGEQVGSGPADPETVIGLERALVELEALDPRQARIVECRFYAGLSVEETAEALGISVPTVKRDWRAARAWLARALT
jgi:RNA polymerase sigma factor (TIGR02999 family)